VFGIVAGDSSTEGAGHCVDDLDLPSCSLRKSIDEIARRTGRDVAPAAVYVTFRRLEENGMLGSSTGQPTGERGESRRRW
jgi:hypothetical protein